MKPINLSVEDVDYICRHALAPQREEWMRVLATDKNEIFRGVAQNSIERIERLFVTLGWWSQETKEARS
jgi:hypothetical protein